MAAGDGRTLADAGFAPGQTTLDLGCRPGLATRDLARLVGPNGKFIDVDVSAKFINHVNAQPREEGAASIETHLLRLEEDDLPIEPGTLDAISMLTSPRWSSSILTT